MQTTKRKILSYTITIFDCWWLMGSVIVAAKIIMHNVWRDWTGWGSVDIYQTREKYQKNVPLLLNELLTPQLIFKRFTIMKVQIWQTCAQVLTVPVHIYVVPTNSVSMWRAIQAKSQRSLLWMIHQPYAKYRNPI